MSDLATTLGNARRAGEARLLSACVQALGALRPMAPEGAARLCRELIEAHQAADDLARALEELAGAERCLGCGTCCLASSPTLYLADLALVEKGGPGRECFYTLRQGEMAHSARLGRAAPLARELIKLREKPGGGCVFLKGGQCGIYEQRPLQCRNLECWSGRDASALALQPRLGRAEIFSDDETALALMAEYDVKLPAVEMARAFRDAADGDQTAAAWALQMIELDHRLRLGINRRYGYPFEELGLLLGRPAVLVCRSHGLEPLPGPGGPTLARQRQ